MQAIALKETIKASHNSILIRTSTNTIIPLTQGWLLHRKDPLAKIFLTIPPIPISHKPTIAKHKMVKGKLSTQQRLRTH